MKNNLANSVIHCPICQAQVTNTVSKSELTMIDDDPIVICENESYTHYYTAYGHFMVKSFIDYTWDIEKV